MPDTPTKCDCSTEDDGSGCALLLGIVIVALAIGEIWSAAYGWLFIGASLLALVAQHEFVKARRRS